MVIFKSFNIRLYEEICQGRQTGASCEGTKDLGREWKHSQGNWLLTVSSPKMVALHKIAPFILELQHFCTLNSWNYLCVCAWVGICCIWCRTDQMFSLSKRNDNPNEALSYMQVDHQSQFIKKVHIKQRQLTILSEIQGKWLIKQLKLFKPNIKLHM